MFQFTGIRIEICWIHWTSANFQCDSGSEKLQVSIGLERNSVVYIFFTLLFENRLPNSFGIKWPAVISYEQLSQADAGMQHEQAESECITSSSVHQFRCKRTRCPCFYPERRQILALIFARFVWLIQRSERTLPLHIPPRSPCVPWTG